MTRTRSLLIGALALLTLGAPHVPARAAAEAFRDASLPVEERVNDLVARLTLDEKIDLLAGNRRVGAVPRLGLEPLLLADGPLGIRKRDAATAYPASISLAASWDVDLAHGFGTSIGRDSRARGIHFLLAPGTNIIRVPHNGRNFEYYSEDPFLSSAMVSHVVRGVQGQGVVATVKHFAANNQETNRQSIDVVVDERTLREIYLPAFRAAVQEGGAGAVMAAYNKLNGMHASEHGWLLREVLKEQWEFQGFVMSDWRATQSTLGALEGGLDLEMPNPVHLNAGTIKPLLDSGRITTELIDEKLRRLFRVIIAHGFLDRPQKDATIPLDDPKSDAVARDIAMRGTVLLKNEGDLLPLERSKLKSVVVLGPNADRMPVAGGSSEVRPFRHVSLLEGIRAAVGPDTVVHAITVDAQREFDRLFPESHYDGPLDIEFRPDSSTMTVLGRATADTVDIDWSGRRPAKGVPDPTYYHAEWNGRITARQTGNHLFLVRTHGGMTVEIDGEKLFFANDNPTDAVLWGETWLEAGRSYALKLRYMCRREHSYIKLAWGPAPAPLAPEQAELVRSADAVVVSAGFDVATEAEGRDRPYAIPGTQRELLRAVTDLNRNTVVVLNSGGSVETADWIEQVPALMHAWYPGQSGGTALAALLFGDANPSGKLPFTWERRWEDHPAYGNFPGSGERVTYAEGVFVGYRFFDARQVEPLFPFGHGLSYTTFRYDDLRIDSATDEDALIVSFDITNTGKRAGAEIAQVYIAPPASAEPRPPRELKGFARLKLAPGETQRAQVRIARADLAWFDAETRAWRTDAGTYRIHVGASSRDLRLEGRLSVPTPVSHPLQ